MEEYTTAVELQRVTWGAGFRDIVPAAVLKVTQRVGGVTAGAFDESGQMLGFVYGISGFVNGHLAHWSHMLAVRPDHRDHGIGRRLKEYQRELLQAAGFEWMYWTTDPMVARNAHLNINRLNARVSEYVPDMYGDTGSSLHSFGTDRIVLAWPVRSRGYDGNGGGLDPAPATAPPGSPVLNELDERMISALLGTATRPRSVRIEVPSEVELLSLADARSWRSATRRSFLSAIRANYEVTGFGRTNEGRCYYTLSPSAVGAARS